MPPSAFLCSAVFLACKVFRVFALALRSFDAFSSVSGVFVCLFEIVFGNLNLKSLFRGQIAQNSINASVYGKFCASKIQEKFCRASLLFCVYDVFLGWHWARFLRSFFLNKGQLGT